MKMKTMRTKTNISSWFMGSFLYDYAQLSTRLRMIHKGFIRNKCLFTRFLPMVALVVFLPRITYAVGPANEPCEKDGIIASSKSEIESKISGGKKILLRAGTYNFSTFEVPSGSESSPTVIKPYNCEKVSINVTNGVYPKSNTVIAGLYIKQGGGGYGQAIGIGGDISNVIIRNNDLSNPNSSRINGAITVSIKRGPKNISIDGNFIHDCNEDCIQTDESGPFVIKNNEIKGPVFENLIDIKVVRSNSRIAGNLFWCNTLSQGCGILHGAAQTQSITIFENNRMTGCPSGAEKQLHINGKEDVANRYDLIGNTFTSTNKCEAIQYKACDNCILRDNSFYNTTVKKGSFTATFKLSEESGNIYKNQPHPGPDVVPGENGSNVDRTPDSPKNFRFSTL